MNARELVNERDLYCWHCGTTEGLQTHHRRNRGMGGSKILDTPDNLIRVCAAYNFAMESDSRVANQARDRGHKLGQWGSFDTPILDVTRGIWFILTSDGRKVQGEPIHYRH